MSGADLKEFRAQVKSFSEESLHLLKQSLPLESTRFPSLFTLDIYGGILGMFDLNNLSLRVWNPVNRYFEFIGALEEPALSKALEQAAPILETLGQAADGEAHCEGTGFFAIQSLMNHSCTPNAASLKSEDDQDGHAVVYALRDIAPGEELSLDYMGLNGEATQERQAKLLAQYHFQCACSTCAAEN